MFSAFLNDYTLFKGACPSLDINNCSCESTKGKKKKKTFFTLKGLNLVFFSLFLFFSYLL